MSLDAFGEIPDRPFPRTLRMVYRPPLKTVGIKTRLIKAIASSVEWDGRGRWIEPCLGSGIVLFNLRPRRALVSDINPHVVEFYTRMYRGQIVANAIHDFLLLHSQKFKAGGIDYYHRVRDYFNDEHDPMYFLLLTRMCFNGLIRFNRKGEFNAPFCNEPERLSRKLIIDITRRASWVSHQMTMMQIEFACQDFLATLSTAREGDYAYIDPPYSGRYTGYYDRWSADRDSQLVNHVKEGKYRAMISTWRSDGKGQNPFFQQVIDEVDGIGVVIVRHKYIVGAKADWRKGVLEALLVKNKVK